MQHSITAAMLAALSLASGQANAQAPDAPSQPIAASPSTASAKLIEGTPLPMRLEETISSKSAQEGDRFAIVLTEDVALSDGAILHAGYRGSGEVIDARGNGMLGKTGKLAIRLNYLRVGEQRIKIRASRDAQGSHNTAAQVGTLLLIWPVVPFIKGKSTELRKGTTITAFADVDTPIPLPLPPPPPEL